MGKLKYSLISLLAVCLTAGGVFAAWSFTEGEIKNPDPVNIGANTEGLGGFEYDYVSVKFNAVNGTFPDGDKIKIITSKKGQSVNAVQYNELFGDYSKFPTNGDLVFSHWSDKIEDGEYFSFDNGFKEDGELYAIYVEKTNPKIVKRFNNSTAENDETVAYFAEHLGTQWQLRNFIAEDFKFHSKGIDRGFHYRIIYNGTEYPILSAAKSNGHLNNTYSVNEGWDYLIDGLYNVFFDPEKTPSDVLSSDTLGWVLGGGKAYFQPQFNYRLLGNPVASGNEGWSTEATNIISFNFENEEKTGSGLQKTYTIDKVYFPFHEGESTSREFKPYISHYNIWANRYPNNTREPTLAIGSGAYTNSNLEFYGDNNNLRIKNNTTLAYKVILTVDYTTKLPFQYTDGSHTEWMFVFDNYPTKITVDVEPCIHTINIYDENKNLISSDQTVTSNGKWDTWETELPYKKHSNILKRYEGKWKDIYTDREINFDEININKSYHVYPDYEEGTNTTNQVTIYNVVENNNVYNYASKTIMVYTGSTIAQTIAYYKENNIDTYNDFIGTFGDVNYKYNINEATFSIPNTDTFKLDGFVNGEHTKDNKDKLNISTILNTEITEDIVLKSRYVSNERPVFNVSAVNTNNAKFLFSTPTKNSFATIRDNSIKTKQDLEYNHVLFIGNSASIDKNTFMFDPISNVDLSSFDITLSFTQTNGTSNTIEKGAFFPTYNTTNKNWTFERVIVFDPSDNWNDDSAKMYIYVFKSQKFIYRSYNSGNDSIYLIPTDESGYIFMRGSTSYSGGWSGYWNRAGNYYASDIGNNQNSTSQNYHYMAVGHSGWTWQDDGR